MESKLNMAVPSALSVFQVHLVQAPTTQVLIDLFLGTAKKMLTLWKEHGFIDDHKFQEIQDQIDLINPPPNIGRIPHKIAAGFVDFTAEQWMLWTTLYSPLVFNGVLRQVHYTHWCLF